MRIAVGPITSLPSWKWVGLDTATELSKYYEVSLFNSFDSLPSCEILLIIKHMPPALFLEHACQQGLKAIYVPIDYYTTQEHLLSQQNVLKKIHLIITHSTRLIPFFAHFTKTRYIDHNGKFFLEHIADYKENGYVLWIGGFQFVPYLLKYLKENPIDYDIMILADYKNPIAVTYAHRFAAHENVEIKLEGDKVNDFQLFDWSEGLQRDMLNEAKAAIDIKGNDFHQSHKPPTKAQKYVCSGVPFAINTESEAHSYFLKEGLALCTPQETKRWLSKEYWNETVQIARRLRESLSLESIGLKYKRYIEETCISD